MRFHGTLNGYKYCCGGEDASRSTCIEFQTQQGSWVTSNTNLPPRWYSISRATANGIYLIGGESNDGDHSKTTTLVKSDGSSLPGEFSMQSSTVLVFLLRLNQTFDINRAACSIPDGDQNKMVNHN